ncbi:MAG: NAD-dependent epimerase/dehydratase family protein [Patescibacteria group bacterium]
MKFFVTGGAGFIGSHIVDRIIKDGNEVVVYDNFSTGHREFIEHHLDNSQFKLVEGDLSNAKLLNESIKGSDFVFHMAAHADVPSGFENHRIDHEQNLEMTQNVLEAMYKNNIKKIAFASTSSVYGDATIHPTPEDYPFEPTSLYGASKAACEAYIHAYASYYEMTSYIFRFVSFVGERYGHGIIIDLLNKLRKNNKEIELFSDGSPKKSSLYVLDGVEAIFTVIKKSKEQFNLYNIGHTQVLTVDEIVDTILNASGHKNTKKKWLGKASNWKGDNELVHLSIDKLSGLGWEPKLSIEEGIRKTINSIKKS